MTAGPGDDLIRLEIPVTANGVKLPGEGVYLGGGAGADSYIISSAGVGSGRLFINDLSRSGETNSLVLGFGHGTSGVRLGLGSLKLSVAGDGLEIHLQNFDPADVLGGPRDIDRFTFGDGTVLGYEALVERGFDIDGSDADDRIEGTSVTDRITGLAGHDTLVGGKGDDVLTGGAGDDTLDGGPGADLLLGGSGLDTYVFGLGDSPVSQEMSVIDDADGASRIQFRPGVAPDDVRLEAVLGDLYVHYSEQDTLVVLDGARAGQVLEYRFGSTVLSPSALGGVVWQTNGAPVLSGEMAAITMHEGRPVSVPLPQDLFSDPDGDALTYRAALDGSDLLPDWIQFDAVGLMLELAPGDATAGSHEITVTAVDPHGEAASTQVPLTILDTHFVTGGTGDDTALGTDGADNIDSGAGDDLLYGRSGDDWLRAGRGDDLLFGGAGADWLRGGGGRDVLVGGTGDDALFGQKGRDELYGRSGDDRLRGGDGRDSLYGNQGDDLLFGNAGDDLICGQDGNDTLSGGHGDDTLHGGSGNDLYRFGLGDGRDEIRNRDHDESPDDVDVLRLRDGTTAESLWFSRESNDLVMQIMGGEDQVRVAGWFRREAARIDRIALHDGESILADRVEQLVNAVAAFDVQPASVIELSATQQEEYATMVSGYWEAPTAATA